MIIGYIKDAKEHIEAAIQNLERFLSQAHPRGEDGETIIGDIGYITDKLKKFLREHEDVFHEIIGG